MTDKVVIVVVVIDNNNNCCNNNNRTRHMFQGSYFKSTISSKFTDGSSSTRLKELIQLFVWTASLAFGIKCPLYFLFVSSSYIYS